MLLLRDSIDLPWVDITGESSRVEWDVNAAALLYQQTTYRRSCHSTSQGRIQNLLVLLSKNWVITKTQHRLRVYETKHSMRQHIKAHNSPWAQDGGIFGYWGFVGSFKIGGFAVSVLLRFGCEDFSTGVSVKYTLDLVFSFHLFPLMVSVFSAVRRSDKLPCVLVGLHWRPRRKSVSSDDVRHVRPVPAMSIISSRETRFGRRRFDPPGSWALDGQFIWKD